MDPYPTLRTEQLLLLRPFAPDDAPTLRRLARARDLARTMLNLPHPYEEGMAEEWIASLRLAFEAGTRAAFAVTLREGGVLVGTVSLFVDERSGEGLLAFWVDLPYWGRATPRRPSLRWCATASRIAACASSGPTASGATRLPGGS